MSFTVRPVIRGRRMVISSGHHLATHAGMRMMEAGGNAFDAAAAAGFCLQVLEPCENGPGGEVSIILRSGRERRVRTLCGQGCAPSALSVKYLRSLGLKSVPASGLLPAMVPGAVSAWLVLLREYGSLSLSEVLAPAIELARDGFPAYEHLCEHIAQIAPDLRSLWPTSGEVYLPGGQPPKLGATLTNLPLAAVYGRMVKAAAGYTDRKDQIEAAHRSFYEGEAAAAIVDFCRRKAPTKQGDAFPGVITREDMANYRAGFESPVFVEFKGYRVYKNGPWCQGPVFLQQLQMFSHLSLSGVEWDSPERAHLCVEVWKRAAADRNSYYGDPAFDGVPLARLLSPGYAASRASDIDPARASSEAEPVVAAGSDETKGANGPEGGDMVSRDTTFVCVADAEGNLISATASGGWLMSSPVIPDVGFPLGNRGVIFHLDPSRPNCLAPGKRPRTTLSPSLAEASDGRWIAFGTPGGDAQDQISLQFFLAHAVYGLGLQLCAETGFAVSYHHVDSFSHRAQPMRVEIDPRFREWAPAMERMGHRVTFARRPYLGQVQAVAVPADGGRWLEAATSPGAMKAYADGW